MLFQSSVFFIFLIIVLGIYFLIGSSKYKLQNLLILIASYFFYGWWDWRFLFLIFISTFLDYLIALKIKSCRKHEYRLFLIRLSLLCNLGVLGFFKYYNFFLDSFIDFMRIFGLTVEPNYLSIILPIGISFYTLQTLSYTIDVYRGKLNAEKDFIAFAAFISFFPQLVAGPIERASNLLPQFVTERNFSQENFIRGIRSMLYGFFMKLVIADNCAKYVNIAFENPSLFHGATLFLATCLFSFQIYCDFAGYSFIAKGTANLFGFSLMMNFNKPYFSTNISEFWSRWHISLTTWFKDYLYIPLGGSRLGNITTIRNVLIVFFVSGLWHGANYTFLMWGFINALLFIPFVLFSNRANRHRSQRNTIISRVNYVFKLLLTFVLISLTWIFFRSETLTKAFYILRNIFSFSFFRSFYNDIRQLSDEMNLIYFIFILILFVSYEWISKDELSELSFIDRIKSNTIKLICYYLLLTLLFLFSSGSQDFIYFQF